MDRHLLIGVGIGCQYKLLKKTEDAPKWLEA
jgi:hypothetical protein